MAKTLAKIFGAVFILVGLLGFISNGIVGAAGIFQTNMAHDIAHILIGLILVLASKDSMRAALWLKIFGVVYLLLAVLGFMALKGGVESGSMLGFITVNGADNWLHIVLGVVLLIAGMMKPGAPMMANKMPENNQ